MMQSYVMEAGPNNKPSLGSVFGTLEIQQYNLPQDVISNYQDYNLQEISTPKQYDNWQGFAKGLQDDFKSYDYMSHPDYDPIPISWLNQGCCNSFTGSLLRDNGSNWEPDYWVPGWDVDIDFGYYDLDYNATGGEF
jgi:hypothetical protein